MQKGLCVSELLDGPVVLTVKQSDRWSGGWSEGRHAMLVLDFCQIIMKGCVE